MSKKIMLDKKNIECPLVSSHRANKISIVKKEDNRILFSLSADMIIHRKRISKIFVYQNLKEI